jgi:hypothetical protein
MSLRSAIQRMRREGLLVRTDDGKIKGGAMYAIKEKDEG